MGRYLQAAVAVQCDMKVQICLAYFKFQCGIVHPQRKLGGKILRLRFADYLCVLGQSYSSRRHIAQLTDSDSLHHPEHQYKALISPSESTTDLHGYSYSHGFSKFKI